MWSEPSFYRTAFSGIFSSGGLLHSDWLPPNRVIAIYLKFDLISTLLNALIVQDLPRCSCRSSSLALIENEGLPATLTRSLPAVWTRNAIRHNSHTQYFLNLSLAFSCVWHVSCALQTNAADFIAQNMRCEMRTHCLRVLPLAGFLSFL